MPGPAEPTGLRALCNAPHGTKLKPVAFPGLPGVAERGSPGSFSGRRRQVTCDEVLARLDDYLDRNLSPDEVREVDQHLDKCLACLLKCRFEQSLLAGLRSRLRRIDLPPHLLASLSFALTQRVKGRS
jgi:anti-sigma factor (TIGR02949 family)